MKAIADIISSKKASLSFIIIGIAATFLLLSALIYFLTQPSQYNPQTGTQTVFTSDRAENLCDNTTNPDVHSENTFLETLGIPSAKASQPITPGGITLILHNKTIDMEKDTYTNKTFQIEVCAYWPADQQNSQAQIYTQASGIANQIQPINHRMVNDTFWRGTGEITLSGNGTGQISASLRTASFGGAFAEGLILGKNTRLYTGDGGAGFITLRASHINWLYEKGKISFIEREQRLEDLTTGTANTTIITQENTTTT